MANNEQDHSRHDLHVVNLREFLSKPFDPPWAGITEQPPDLELLKYLLNLNNEIGLVYKDQQWTIAKGFLGMGVLAKHMPRDANILIHSHYIIPIERFKRYGIQKSPNGIGSEIPASGDLYNCSSTGKNFIVSEKGITQYFFSMPQEQRDLLFIDPVESTVIRGVKMLRKELRELERDSTEYLFFLRKIGARLKFNNWEEMTNEKLNVLFYSQSKNK